MATLSTSQLQIEVWQDRDHDAAPVLRCRIWDKITHATEAFVLHHTDHSQRRAAQRGIAPEEIAAAIALGKPVRKQQMIFYMLRRKDVPVDMMPQIQGRLVDLVVITCAESQQLVTCYKNQKHVRRIRKKSKRNARSGKFTS